MSLKETASFIISLVILGLVVFFSLQLAKHPKTAKMRDVLTDRAAASYDSLRDSITISRRAPISTIELEENLKVNLPAPFISFSQEDWKWFWHLLYGKFTQDSAEWPRTKRQLTREEVQNELTVYYSTPFASFGEREWTIFWQDILKGKVF